MSQASKLLLIKEMVESADASLHSAKMILDELTGGQSKKSYTKIAEKLPDLSGDKDDEGEKIVEGIFNGQNMTGRDKNEYPVPANYASKSKLVPGDTLKLTIKEDGSFLYKQIGPVERDRIVGTLTYEDSQYKVIANRKAYKVLLASVTYFKAEVGDKVTLVVPKNEESEWGAIENVLPKDSEEIDLDEEI
ncbi:hypothetical protein A3B60_02245 [Candidatus Peregrinibacteria bacterium RIFCSPLOWO2_01_FULL_39_12]|nr:MAG: hypothetical protein A3B60_02245 [Candidatus Peregrinibacteria bacterium RIFCSPLOWO2_01_FULL_39_12]OGJ43631.1 MAG: hypothetical protein A3I58_02955 [Candidatus Peregrinibacteria bacterium RIFCSPLOWO2_02_FULL_39_10]